MNHVEIEEARSGGDRTSRRTGRTSRRTDRTSRRTGRTSRRTGRTSRRTDRTSRRTDRPSATAVTFLGLRSLAVGAALFVLSLGCGGEDSGVGSFTITLWDLMDPQERAIRAAQIEAYEQAHPGVEIEVSHYDVAQLQTEFQTAATAGSGPDLVYGPSDQVGPLSAMGQFLPIDSVMPAEELGDFRSDSFDRLNGHIYAIPDQVGNHLTLVYNKALLPHPPKTMGELIEVAKSQTLDDDGDGQMDRYGLVFQVMEPLWTVPFLTGYGGWVIDAESRPTLHSGAMTKALALIRSFRDEHRIMPSECDYEIADAMFKEGRAAMIINGPWSFEAYRQAGLDIGLARIPQIEETGLWPAPMVSSNGYSLNAKLEGARLDAVLDAVRYLTQVDFQVEYAEQVGTLPTRNAAYERAEVGQNEVLRASSEQVEVGKRMPVVPEMGVIWDAMRPSVQNVWNGVAEPSDASRQMQELAARKIRERKG